MPPARASAALAPLPQCFVSRKLTIKQILSELEATRDTIFSTDLHALANTATDSTDVVLAFFGQGI